MSLHVRFMKLSERVSMLMFSLPILMVEYFHYLLITLAATILALSFLLLNFVVCAFVN